MLINHMLIIQYFFHNFLLFYVIHQNLKEEIYCNKLKILSSTVKNGFYSDFCHIFVLNFVICSSLHPCGVSLFPL